MNNRSDITESIFYPSYYTDRQGKSWSRLAHTIIFGKDVDEVTKAKLSAASENMMDEQTKETFSSDFDTPREVRPKLMANALWAALNSFGGTGVAMDWQKPMVMCFDSEESRDRWHDKEKNKNRELASSSGRTMVTRYARSLPEFWSGSENVNPEA